MPESIVFPRSLLREQSGKWRRGSATIAGGQTGAGSFPVTSIDGGGVWLCDYGSINLSTPTHIKLWRAIAEAQDGGVSTVVVPMCDSRQAPRPLVNGKPVKSYGSIPFSDGALFSDGSGFYQQIIAVQSVGVAALRATTITMRLIFASPLEGGEFFSIVHPTQGKRLYAITGVSIDDSGNSVVKFRPPLREAVSDGETIDFDDVGCTMRLQNPNAMDVELSMRRFANPDAAFVEAFF